MAKTSGANCGQRLGNRPDKQQGLPEDGPPEIVPAPAAQHDDEPSSSEIVHLESEGGLTTVRLMRVDASAEGRAEGGADHEKPPAC